MTRCIFDHSLKVLLWNMTNKQWNSWNQCCLLSVDSKMMELFVLSLTGTEDWKERRWRIRLKKSSRRCSAASSLDTTTTSLQEHAVKTRRSSNSGRSLLYTSPVVWMDPICFPVLLLHLGTSTFSSDSSIETIFSWRFLHQKSFYFPSCLLGSIFAPAGGRVWPQIDPVGRFSPAD